MEKYVFDTDPMPGTDDGDGTAMYALRNSKRPQTILCYMRLAVGDVDFFNKLYNAQAAKAWQEGTEAADDETFAAGKLTNPYTVQQ